MDKLSSLSDLGICRGQSDKATCFIRRRCKLFRDLNIVIAKFKKDGQTFKFENPKPTQRERQLHVHNLHTLQRHHKTYSHFPNQTACNSSNPN